MYVSLTFQKIFSFKNNFIKLVDYFIVSKTRSFENFQIILKLFRFTYRDIFVHCNCRLAFIICLPLRCTLLPFMDIHNNLHCTSLHKWFPVIIGYNVENKTIFLKKKKQKKIQKNLPKTLNLPFKDNKLQKKLLGNFSFFN